MRYRTLEVSISRFFAAAKILPSGFRISVYLDSDSGFFPNSAPFLLLPKIFEMAIHISYLLYVLSSDFAYIPSFELTSFIMTGRCVFEDHFPIFSFRQSFFPDIIRILKFVFFCLRSVFSVSISINLSDNLVKINSDKFL